MSLFCQNWVNIKKTEIEFSKLNTKEENKRLFKYEYFKKKDKIIAIPWYKTDVFLELFERFPKSFDTLFEKSVISKKNEVQLIVF